MNEKDKKHCIELYKQKRYKVNSERNMDVDSENVMMVTKKGRKLIICSCCNDTKFCVESPICRHKNFFIAQPFIDHFDKKISKLIEEYEGYKNIKCDISTESMLNDLKNLKL